MPLMPKRVKYRKTQRGSRAGTASRNISIDFGEYGLQTLDRVDVIFLLVIAQCSPRKSGINDS